MDDKLKGLTEQDKKFLELKLIHGKKYGEAYVKAYKDGVRMKNTDTEKAAGFRKMQSLKEIGAVDMMGEIATERLREHMMSKTERISLDASKFMYEQCYGKAKSAVDLTSGGEQIKGFPMYLPEQNDSSMEA